MDHHGPSWTLEDRPSVAVTLRRHNDDRGESLRWSSVDAHNPSSARVRPVPQLFRRHREVPKRMQFDAAGVPQFPQELTCLAEGLRERSNSLGVGDLNLPPYQLRHEGPSFDTLSSRRTLIEVHNWGRWDSLSSVRRCEKAA